MDILKPDFAHCQNDVKQTKLMTFQIWIQLFHLAKFSMNLVNLQDVCGICKFAEFDYLFLGPVLYEFLHIIMDNL